MCKFKLKVRKTDYPTANSLNFVFSKKKGKDKEIVNPDANT